MPDPGVIIRSYTVVHAGCVILRDYSGVSCTVAKKSCGRAVRSTGLSELDPLDSVLAAYCGDSIEATTILALFPEEKSHLVIV
jgi:hypothetical protein